MPLLSSSSYYSRQRSGLSRLWVRGGVLLTILKPALVALAEAGGVALA